MDLNADAANLRHFKLENTIVRFASASTREIYEFEHHGSVESNNIFPSTLGHNGIVWRRIRKIGEGQYGTVYLESSPVAGGLCHRAVKEFKIGRGQTYQNEILNMIRMRNVSMTCFDSSLTEMEVRMINLSPSKIGSNTTVPLTEYYACLWNFYHLVASSPTSMPGPHRLRKT